MASMIGLMWLKIWAGGGRLIMPYRKWGFQKIWETSWLSVVVESSWNVMASGDAREGNWRGTWRMEWVASTLHTTSKHGVPSITTTDAHTSAVSSRLNWRPRRFKWTRPFRRKTKSGFCASVITFQTQSTYVPFSLCLNITADNLRWHITHSNFSVVSVTLFDECLLLIVISIDGIP